MAQNQRTQQSTSTTNFPPYDPLSEDWKLPKCCYTDHPDDPQGCYCCYDSWKNELKTASQNYANANETAIQLQSELAFISGRRDKLKIWVDELTKADELADDVCTKFGVIICQVENICENSGKAVEAINILFCMIRDFFEQIDKIKTILNEINNCIKCINSSELSPGTGIMKCLTMYEEKLDAVLKTRDELIKILMEVIEIANMLNMDICDEYGLSYIIEEWQAILNCAGTIPETDPCKCHEEKHLPEHCHLKPMITFPIDKSQYLLEDLNKKYDEDIKKADDLKIKYDAAKKKKEALSACVNSLKAAIAVSNPADRCK